MSGPLILAIPSKGRLKEQAEAWLADCGLHLVMEGGARGYAAALDGLPGVEVRLLSAADIAVALEAGEVHLGVTGEDLLAERGSDDALRRLVLRRLAFGRADLVVAVPKSWLDVDGMADLEEVAHEHLARTGARIRVATKYLTQTRAFFARHGLADYRIVESGGATEGAPAAGQAELVIDITTTGATLAANGLKVLPGGTILKSQALLVAALSAPWDPARLTLAERLLRIVEARGAALSSATLIWSGDGGRQAAAVVQALIGQGAKERPNGLLLPAAQASQAAADLAAAGIGPVTVTRPQFLFESTCPAAEALAAQVI